MTTVGLGVFLIAHGLVHLAIWLPKPRTDGPPPPFVPYHSMLLSAVDVPKATNHRLSVALAVATAAAFVTAGIAVPAGVSWVVPVAVVAAGIGLALKVLFFHPWLSIGVILDIGVLLAALTAWPVSLQ